MVISPYGEKKIMGIRKTIEDAGYLQYEEEIFEIARWSAGAEGKLSRIANLLSTHTSNTYRITSKKHWGDESSWRAFFLERKTPREGKHRLWKYKWIYICSTLARYWNYPLELLLDNLTEEEYNILSLVRDIQAKYDIPMCGDPYAHTVNNIIHRLKMGKDRQILVVPSEEYLYVAEKLSVKMDSSPHIIVRV